MYRPHGVPSIVPFCQCAFPCFCVHFLCPRVHLPRALHSFPTRRSSDLGVGRFGASFVPHLVGYRRCDCGGLGHRSEEHTSELQSRGHLVCRLLLENKTLLRTVWTTATRTLRTAPTGAPQT